MRNELAHSLWGNYKYVSIFLLKIEHPCTAHIRFAYQLLYRLCKSSNPQIPFLTTTKMAAQTTHQDITYP